MLLQSWVSLQGRAGPLLAAISLTPSFSLITFAALTDGEENTAGSRCCVGVRAEWLERELSLADPAAYSLFCCACCAVSGECGFTLVSNMKRSHGKSPHSSQERGLSVP